MELSNTELTGGNMKTACSSTDTTGNEKVSMKYKDAEIDARIYRAVEEMGFANMTPIQEQAIPVLLGGKDVIGQAQTGTGKTAAFGIPVIQNIDMANHNLQAVILCPTRELAIQAAEEMHRFSKYMHGVRILPIYGGQDINRQIRALKGGVQIIVGTPGRVMDHMRRRTLKMEHVSMMVLDEADEMLNMGFREDIETILQGIPTQHQTALFSATMPQAILDITNTYQKDAVYLKMTRQELTIPLVKQYFYRVNSQTKIEVASRLLDYYGVKRSLIFCNTKRMVDELSEKLKNKGYAAEGLHGDLSQNQRDTVMNRFRGGNLEILIATDVAARGIDVDDVEAVFNYDLPQDIEYYVHRIGRTGRAGREGRSFTFVANREMYRLRDIERSCKTRIEERKIPSASDIVSIKVAKTFHDALKVLEDADLERLTETIERKLVDTDYSAAELAAALMKLQMGEEPQEIRDVIPERRNSGKPMRGNGSREFRGGRESSYGNRSGSGRTYGGNRGKDFGSRSGQSGRRDAQPVRDGQPRHDSSDNRGGRSASGDFENRKFDGQNRKPEGRYRSAGSAGSEGGRRNAYSGERKSGRKEKIS